MDPTRVTLTSQKQVWADWEWINVDGLVSLEQVDVEVEPPQASRAWIIHRKSDNMVLANGGWFPSRARAVRAFPPNTDVPPGDGVIVQFVSWEPEPVVGKLVLHWR